MAEWSEHVRRAATVIKIIKLRGMMGMDSVAVRLNMEPTVPELIEATRWLAAFEATETPNVNLLAIADDLDLGRHN